MEYYFDGPFIHQDTNELLEQNRTVARIFCNQPPCRKTNILEEKAMSDSPFNTYEDQYKNALLYGQKEKIDSLKEKIGKECSPEIAQKIFTTAEKWKKQCHSLTDQAVAFAKNGGTRKDLQFDELEKKARTLGGNAKAYLCQKFDTALAEYQKNQDDPSAASPAAESSLSDLVNEIQMNSFQGNHHKSGINSSARNQQDNNTPLYWPQEWEKPPYSGKPPLRIEQTPGHCMYQYCFYGLMYNGENRELMMKEMLKKYIRLGGKESQRTEDQKFADSWLKQAQKVMRDSKTEASDSPRWSSGSPLSSCIRKKKENQKNREKRTIVAGTHKVDIQPISFTASPPRISTFSPHARHFPAYKHHPNDIAFLPPAEHWFLYIDESYRAKDGNGDLSFQKGGDGVIGGILFTQGALPHQPPLHVSQDATEEKMTAADKVVETIIHSRCGVLALPARACASPQGWGPMIGAYIDLVLRLLPLNGKCRVDVRIEGRDPYRSAKDCFYLRDACRFFLMESFPERADLIDLNIEIQDKSDPYNSYPDIIAHTCRMRKESNLAEPRFLASKWNGCCFLNYDAGELRGLLELYFTGREISPENWALLLRDADATRNSFLAGILQTIGLEARKEMKLWKKYLDFVVGHLESKAINMRQLKNQMDWLKLYEPEDSRFPPRLRLLWLTAKLAEANHKGSVTAFAGHREEFVQLSKRLFEEDAPLTCHAALNIAVSFTDEYLFDKAKEILEPWKGCRPEVPGLQYYGRLLSSFGQHEAFLGKNESAIAYFQQAISAFQRLSEPESAKKDIRQTSAYLLTAMMDTPVFDRAAFQKAAAEFFESSLTDAILHLSISDSDEEKYAHHILLRYLAAHGSDTEKRVFLSTEKDWKTGKEHPWEMIEFYRAMLLGSSQKKMEHLQNAYAIAMNGEETLHVIAAVILGTILLNQPEKVDEYRDLVEHCATEIPALGTRLDILREHPKRNYPPLELAARVLPFNFR